jgi:hypothetical protein
MKYKAYLKQAAEGCDYTIGCAQTVIDIEASNIVEAKELLFNKIKKNYTGEYKLESCEIYEINEIEICDLDTWYSTISIEKQQEKQALIDARDRIEYERLRKKFDK